jgi:ATP sulfurylase
VRCYKALCERYYSHDRTLLNLILAVRMAGPRAGLGGIINRNYGVNHFIIGRDPHGRRRIRRVRTFTTPASAALFQEHEAEIGVRIIPHKWYTFLAAAGMRSRAGPRPARSSSSAVRHAGDR